MNTQYNNNIVHKKMSAHMYNDELYLPVVNVDV